MKRAIQMVVLVALLVLVLAPAALAVQPSQTNADNRNGGVTTVGPHCHFNLKARANNNSPHGDVLTGAIHEAHLTTNVSAGGVFEATDCPAD
ncbi:MAG: hypothetical protein ACRDU9_09000 [Acidimicrobiia bacterium]